MIGLCSIVCLISAQMTLASTNKNDKEYLFVQTAKKAEIKATQTDRTYTLTFKDISPYVVYFTDRPNRETGHLSMQEYLTTWKNGADTFAKSAPNAALEGVKFAGIKNGMEAVSYTFALSQPVYNEKANTLAYTVTLLSGEKVLTKEQLGKMRRPVLFIDGICYGCIGK